LPAPSASGATGLQSAPARAGEEEGDEAELMRGSPKLERQRRGGATVEEGGGGELHDKQALEQGSSRVEWRGASGWGAGWSSSFYRAGGRRGGGCLGLMAGVNSKDH
jgi:hypothetical protein